MVEGRKIFRGAVVAHSACDAYRLMRTRVPACSTCPRCTGRLLATCLICLDQLSTCRTAMCTSDMAARQQYRLLPTAQKTCMAQATNNTLPVPARQHLIEAQNGGGFAGEVQPLVLICEVYDTAVVTDNQCHTCAMAGSNSPKSRMAVALSVRSSRFNL